MFTKRVTSTCSTNLECIDLQAMVNHKHPIHVKDLGDGSSAKELPMDGRTRRLLLSYPRDDRLQLLYKLVMSTTTIIIPLWTLAELQQARALCFPALTSEEVQSSFTNMEVWLILEYLREASEDLFECNYNCRQ